jgi:hypothetical protein
MIEWRNIHGVGIGGGKVLIKGPIPNELSPVDAFALAAYLVESAKALTDVFRDSPFVTFADVQKIIRTKSESDQQIS